MAWIGEAGAAKINVAANVGAEIRNVSRNGRSVYFEYRAYLYQSTSAWSTNVWAVWTEGNRYVVKDRSQSSQNTKYYGGWVGKTVDIDPGATTCTISVGTQGNNWDPWDPGYVNLTVHDLPTCSKPSLSGLTTSNVSDKSADVSFSINSSNNGTVTDSYIDLSLSNFGSVVKSISSRSGTFTGLDPNRTYYARGNAANAAGRSYTGVKAFTTGFVDPGSPGKPSLSCDQEEYIPKAKLTAKWSAANAGSTAVAGYRIRLYKNDVEVSMVDTESTSTKYTFNSFENLGFKVGDVAKVGIYAYSKDWNGGKHFNGGGSGTSQVYSGTVTVVSDKYIFVSSAGGAFDKKKMYISVNGAAFVEVKKEKFKIIK